MKNKTFLLIKKRDIYNLFDLFYIMHNFQHFLMTRTSFAMFKLVPMSMSNILYSIRKFQTMSRAYKTSHQAACWKRCVSNEAQDRVMNMFQHRENLRGIRPEWDW